MKENKKNTTLYNLLEEYSLMIMVIDIIFMTE